MKYLCPKFSLLISLIAYNLKWLARPPSTTWEAVYSLIECTLVLERWLCSVACLGAFLDFWFR
jgi:hypothetical protein